MRTSITCKTRKELYLGILLLLVDSTTGADIFATEKLLIRMIKSLNPCFLSLISIKW